MHIMFVAYRLKSDASPSQKKKELGKTHHRGQKNQFKEQPHFPASGP